MKKFIVIIVSLALSHAIVLAQGCLPEGITFATQEQIDNFRIDYPNCSEIEGDMEITGFDITNLNGLNVLTSIGGHLWISSNSNLIDLAGLENITSIGGTLSIHHNESLISLNTLNNVTHIGGVLGIGNNPVLPSLSGLEGITSVGGDISISHNNALDNLLGLENITSAGGLSITDSYLSSLIGLNNLDTVFGNVDINWNNSLINLSGLDNLAFIGNNLRLYKNDALTSYTGLEHLSMIEGDLCIGDCFSSPPFYDTSLSSIAALENLTSVSRLFIENNIALTSLAGLDNINANSVQDIIIFNNWSLSECEVQSICDYLADSTAYISNNASGCNSPEQVQEACLYNSIEETSINIDITISPNPVNNLAVLSLFTPSKSLLWVCIYNITGVCVKNWKFQNQQPGYKEYNLDLKDLPTGVYFCQVQIGNEIATRKIITAK